MGLHEVRSNFIVCSKYILTKVNIYIEMQVAVLPGADFILFRNSSVKVPKNSDSENTEVHKKAVISCEGYVS